MTLHDLPVSTSHLPDPSRFTYPFCYEPHPLCVAAAEAVRAYLDGQGQWADELARGKMMGVLVVRHQGKRGFLAAFSGTLGGLTRQDYFVPPVFDTMQPGGHFEREQARISAMSRRLAALQGQARSMRAHLGLDELLRERDAQLQTMRAEAAQAKIRRQKLRQELSPRELAARADELARESQHQKAELRRAAKRWERRVQETEAPLRALTMEEQALAAERKLSSEALQQWLFGQYRLLNAHGERRSVGEIFGQDIPPSGTGDCCAPKLLQAAYLMGAQPLCMGEFWIGRSPADEVRRDGHFYPACHSRCQPVLEHMTQGLLVESNPMAARYQATRGKFSVQYADGSIIIVRKPEGMLSVPGKDGLPSVQDILREEFPQGAPPMLAHRLDMDTSGLLLAARTPEAFQSLQRQFLTREVEKTYVALLERPMPVGHEGEISLPLRPDLADRPRQMVDPVHGRTAVTRYRVVGQEGGHARVLLHPVTGRTHQLRVHCAHPLGLDSPIVGDRLYGKTADRLMLHAQSLSFTHPASGKRVTFQWLYI